MITITSIKTAIGYNPEARAACLSHEYSGAPELGLFHTTPLPEHHSALVDAIDAVAEALPARHYQIGEKVLVARPELRHFEARMAGHEEATCRVAVTYIAEEKQVAWLTFSPSLPPDVQARIVEICQGIQNKVHADAGLGLPVSANIPVSLSSDPTSR